MAVTLIFNNSRPRRAVVRDGDRGRIIESVVCDPGMTRREAEHGALDAARLAGVKPTDRSIQITGDPGKPKAPVTKSFRPRDRG